METLQAAISATRGPVVPGIVLEDKKKFNDSPKEHSPNNIRVRKHQLDGGRWRVCLESVRDGVWND